MTDEADEDLLKLTAKKCQHTAHLLASQIRREEFVDSAREEGGRIRVRLEMSPQRKGKWDNIQDSEWLDECVAKLSNRYEAIDPEPTDVTSPGDERAGIGEGHGAEHTPAQSYEPLFKLRGGI